MYKKAKLGLQEMLKGNIFLRVINQMTILIAIRRLI